jgi:hypothetical protein
MCRRHFNLCAESVEQRVSLSGLAAATPTAAEVQKSSFEVESALISNLSPATPRPGGPNGIIAILIG